MTIWILKTLADTREIYEVEADSEQEVVREKFGRGEVTEPYVVEADGVTIVSVEKKTD